MAKRPKAARRQSSSWRPPRLRKRTRAHWDREILGEVLSIWARSAKGVTQDTVGPYLYGITIGTLTAAKLMVRLQSGGSLTFDGDPRVLQTIEEMADEIAAEHFDVIADQVFGKGA